MRFARFAIFVLLSLTVQAGAQDPETNSSSTDKLSITSIAPSPSSPGSRVTIQGRGFGKEQGKGTATFNGKAAKISHWDDNMIIATVPSGSAVGEAVVVVNVDKPGPNDAAKATTSSVTAGGDAKFSVAAPEFDPSHFEVLTGVGAVLAGKEATSYTTRNDAISSTNVGRKTPEILLGGGFILPWHKGGRWIENSYCGKSVPVVVDKQKTGQTKKVTVQAPVDTPKDVSPDCQIGGAYKNYRPYEAFVSIRFSPASDQSINGFVLGGGYRITKYLSLLAGYSVTPVQEVSRGFRIAAAKIVTDNPSLAPYNRYNPTSLLNDYPAAFDGFPLFVYNASGVTTTKLFPNDPTVSHYRSGIFFGVGFPLNLTSLFKPAKSQ